MIRRKGYTLITVVFIITILIILASIGLGVAITEIKLTKNQQGSVEALYVAETGANRALYYLDNDTGVGGWKEAFENPPGSKEWTNISLGTGQTYTVRADFTTHPTKPNTVVAKITATGTSKGAKGTAARKLQIIAEKGFGTSAGNLQTDVAILSLSNFYIGDSANVSIRSGDIYSNGGIEFNNSGNLSLRPDCGDPDPHYAFLVNSAIVKTGRVGNDGISRCQRGNSPPHAAITPDISGYKNAVERNMSSDLRSANFTRPFPTITGITPQCTFQGNALNSNSSYINKSTSPWTFPNGVNCSVMQINRGTGTVIEWNGSRKLEIKGTVYIKSNFRVGSSGVKVNGDIHIDGTYQIEGPFEVSGNVYGRGEPGFAFMPPVVPGGSMVFGGRLTSNIEINGKTRLKGVFNAIPGAPSLSGVKFVGGIEADSDVQFGSNPSQSIGINASNSRFGDLLANGNMVISGANSTFGDLRSSKNITLQNLGNTRIGDIYAEESIVLDRIGNYVAGQPDQTVNVSANMYAGKDIEIINSGNITISGVIVAGNDLNLGRVANFSINHIADMPSGMVAGHNLTSNNSGNWNINGIVLVGENIDISRNGNFTVNGGMIGKNINIGRSGNVSIELVSDNVTYSLTGVGGVGGSTGVKVIDWRESY